MIRRKSLVCCIIALSFSLLLQMSIVLASIRAQFLKCNLLYYDIYNKVHYEKEIKRFYSDYIIYNQLSDFSRPKVSIVSSLPKYVVSGNVFITGSTCITTYGFPIRFAYSVHAVGNILGQGIRSPDFLVRGYQIGQSSPTGFDYRGRTIAIPVIFSMRNLAANVIITSCIALIIGYTIYKACNYFTKFFVDQDACAFCKYSQSGLHSPICPECGNIPNNFRNSHH